MVVTLMPGNGKIAGNYLDKVVHFLIFFFLAINVLYAYHDNQKLFLYLALTLILCPLTEFLQQYIPGRNMDLIDTIADFAGVLFAYLLYQIRKEKVDLLMQKMGA